MGYIKAEQVLPDEIIKLIQQYVDGKNIYIPKREDTKSDWGEISGTRRKLQERNKHIYEAYISGSKVHELAEKYFLSEKSIWRIISEQKQINQMG